VQSQTGVASKMTEVTISRYQCDVMVEARLRNEGVGQARLEAEAKQTRTKITRTFPVAIDNIELRNRRDSGQNLTSNQRMAEQFGNHDRGENRTSNLQGLSHGSPVSSLIAREESHH